MARSLDTKNPIMADWRDILYYAHMGKGVLTVDVIPYMLIHPVCNPKYRFVKQRRHPMSNPRTTARG